MSKNKKLIIALRLAVGICLAGARPLKAQQYYNWVACGNQSSGYYEVYDPAVTSWNSAGALMWSFAPTTAGGWTSTEVAAYSNPSDLKLRWSGGNQVVVSCASGGLATVATYPGGTMVWTLDIGGSYNPHSVELLPNGNVAVAASDGNWVRVYAASQSSRNSTYAQFNLTGAHACLWDPANSLLWVLGTSNLTALSVGGTAASPTVSEVTADRISLPGSGGGHDLSPYWGNPNLLWVTESLDAYTYNKTSKTFTQAPASAARSAVKGCGNQASGEIVQCQQDNSVCTLDTWCTPNVDFFNGEGAPDYTRTKTGAAFYKCRVFTPDYQPVSLSLSTARIKGDFNGDGKEDIVMAYDLGGSTTALWVFPSSGSNFTNNAEWWLSGTGSWDAQRSQFIAGDFNGDGKTDIAILYDYGNSTSKLWVFLSTGTNFAAPVLWWQSNTGYWDAKLSKLVAGDFNGDGKTDLAILYDYGSSTSGLWVFTSTGSSFGTPAEWWQSGTGGFSAALSKPFAGDFNGDGKSDVGVLYNYGGNSAGLWVFPSTGTTFTNIAEWWSNSNWGVVGQTTPISGDFNGDGKSDVCLAYDFGNNTLELVTFLSSGSAFTGASWWESVTGNWGSSSSKFVGGDFTGGGKTDVGILYNYGGGSNGLWVFPSTGTNFTTGSEWWSGTSWGDWTATTPF